MILIGITGGIGMGKSLSASFIADRGIPIVDTDLLAREVTAPGTEALSEIHRAFGPGVLSDEGGLSRQRLAEIVFADPGQRRRLESIVHPRIEREWRGQVSKWKEQGVGLGAVVIPLLYERGHEAAFTGIVCLACTLGTQHQRLRTRGWSDKEIAGRISAQLPVSKKMERADFVVWTEGSVHSHRSQWDLILASLTTITCSPA